MLKTKSLTTSIKHIPRDPTPILITLAKAGWQPAVLESERTFLRLAGVEDKIDFQSLRRSRDSFSRRYSAGGIAGDVFFGETDVYYLVVNPGEFFIDELGRRIVRRGSEEPYLEIGIVSSAPQEIDKKLWSFAETVETAIKESGDSKLRNMTLEWNELKSGTPRLDRITSNFDQSSSGPKFTRAKLVSQDIEAAQVLSSKANRELLVELLQAGFAREQDILSRRAKRQASIKKTLNTLNRYGLIQTEFLLECKRTRTPLTRLHDPKKLEDADVADLVCPSCGSSFGEETLSEGYTVSELGRRMARQSHWMTIWTTDLLVKLGIPEDAILWNISENGEEVDLLVEFQGRLWIFELKDREFGAGDAHPLNYRQVRYKANKAIIFTIEKVSKDAKRVFEELQREAMRSIMTRRSELPVYVEGLDKAEEVLRSEIADVSLNYARRRLVMIGETTGYDLGAVLAAKFGEAVSVDDEVDEILF